MTKLMGYNYTMNSSNSRFTISSFLTFSAHIFSEFIFLKYHCTFSLYKVTNFIIGEFTRRSHGTFCKYQPPWFKRHYMLLPQLLTTVTYRTSPATTTATSYLGLPDITCYYQPPEFFISSHHTS